MTAEELINLALAADKVKNFQTSFKYYNQAAEMGNVYAMNEVGSMCLKGAGVAQDYQKSFYWIKKSAEKNSPTAMAMLARFYELGIGIEQDINEALKWYVEAANAGEIHAKQRLEMLFNEGR